jgi:hypothetical protein
LHGQRVQAVVTLGAQSQHLHAGAQTRGPGHHIGQVQAKFFGQVGLVQQHHRPRAAFPRHDQVALDAPLVVVAVEAADDEEHIDVGGQHLLANLALRLLAAELRPALKHLGDDRGIVAQHHPVAHRRPQQRVAPQEAADAGIHLAGFGP